MQQQFPLRRPPQRRGLVRSVVMIMAVSFLLSSAWLFSQSTDASETITAANYKITAADGDSFNIGNRKLRLKGIDAPELHQSCEDASGVQWACGQAAHAALVLLLAEPGLACVTDVSDRYGRALAKCTSNRTADLNAAQVTAGMAASDEFHDLRTYGTEEDEARAAKRGIWRGTFVAPKEWRATHPRNNMQAS
jgi:endonuclease YncB( thermonuclease family)